jgi:FkbM family methyltransferase
MNAQFPPTLRTPRAWRHWRVRRRFLSQFVSPGDRVFDVGANGGEYSRTFVDLGARPVALEPNPDLSTTLHQRLPGVPVEAVAVSDHVGETTLMIGARDREATISGEYAGVLRSRGEDLRRIHVPMTTLDVLAAKHGFPSFVKVDVEGHEAFVLRGMTFSPRALSFEYHPSLLSAARDCLEQLEGRGYAFRATLMFDYSWRTPVMNADMTAQYIAGARDDTFGDVYAFYADPC